MADELKDKYWAGEIGCKGFVDEALVRGLTLTEIERTMEELRKEDEIDDSGL